VTVVEVVPDKLPKPPVAVEPEPEPVELDDEDPHAIKSEQATLPTNTQREGRKRSMG
jgi:hypothetical protein